MPLSAGQRLGHYTILEPLGAGGMGEVFVARDTHLDRRVALKVLPDSVGGSPAARARFEREAKTLAGVSHPNILTIHDYAADGGVYFAVTELLEGETLDERLSRQGALPLDEALRIGRSMARGLAAAHRRQIIHRDIKPSNLFLQSDGGVKILDFGLARSHDTASRGTEAETLVDATVPGTILGTYGYMSPEQARGLPADARSDVFSFGCVLYEMLAGEGPFRRRTNSDALAAVLQEDPRALGERCAGVPAEIEGLIDRCLAKDPEERPASAEELARELDALAGSRSGRGEPATRRRLVVVTLAVVALAAAALLVATLKRQSRERRARHEVLPEIERLVEGGEYTTAVARAGEIEGLLEGDPVLAELVERATGLFALETDPPGATVEVRPYDDTNAPWETLGTTPLDTRHLAIGAYRLRVSLAGYETRELAVAVDRPPPGAASFPDFEWRGLPFGLEKLALSRNGRASGDMEPVEGGRYGPVPLSRTRLGARTLQAYSIDRTEVTNRAYQEFVDGGGYANTELWPSSFMRDGKPVSFQDAMATFRDTTGRPGPATWVLGRPPEGLEEHPVAGTSWYEAAAYCAFRGKSLPTIYHWVRAALAPSEYWAPLAHHIVAASNFSGAGTEPVATRPDLGLMGTYDQAGNVSEWTSTAYGEDRYSLGGSFSDPPYSFNQPFPHSPWDRSPRDGIRCVRYDEEPDPALLAALEPPAQTLLGLPPLSDQTFAALEQLAHYEQRPLNPAIGPFEDRPWGRQQWITIDGPEGTDRLPVRLHLPASGAGPFPVIAYFPGIWCASAPALRGTEIPQDFRFLVEEGYAFVEPVYTGTFERNADGSTMQRIFSTTDGPRLFRQWQRDLSRTLDYLEERPELDSSRVAYLGFSLGTVVSPHLLPFEPRVRACVLLAGGFSADIAQSRLDLQAGLLQRMTLPTLMLGTAWDHLFPPETRQRPFFDYLGSPPEDKRLVIYPVGGHGDLPQTELIKESLDWLERYLPAS